MNKQQRDRDVVLIADDNVFIRFLVKKWLGPVAEIIEVGNGSEVLAAYQKHQPNITFLDIHMPGRNGKDILNDIRAFDANAFVIMLSADSNKNNVVDSIRGGARAFITKPFTRETLRKYYLMCPNLKQPEADNDAGGAAESGS